jgi:hypothetical protein
MLNVILKKSLVGIIMNGSMAKKGAIQEPIESKDSARENGQNFVECHGKM